MSASADEKKPELVSYDAKCHCGAVTYTVKIPSLEQHEVTICNCSICTTNGYLLVYPDRQDIVFHSGEDQLKAYAFNRHMVDHEFCPTCGSSLLIRFKEGGKLGAVNVRMFKDIEPDKLKYGHIDGKNEIPPEDPRGN